jgi:hypothetical protein
MTRSAKRQFNLRISVEAHRVLETVKERDGVPYSAQIERAIRLWAEHKGMVVEAPRHRGGKHAA